MATRASAPANVVLEELGDLAELPGVWAGNGFSLILLPDFDNKPPSTGPTDFRIKVSATRELLDFVKIGGQVPNRGSLTGSSIFSTKPTVGQEDIEIFGVSYFQRIWDAADNSALHLEPGFWLKVPPTTNPNAPESIVRLGAIPHGTTINAQGTSQVVSKPPLVGTADSTPVQNPSTGKPFPIGYLDPLLNAQLPPGIPKGSAGNPNLVLSNASAGQTIVRTVVLQVTAELGSESNGITNIPFVTANAKVTRFSSIFWIETVQRSDGTAFMQLQYTQTVILNFLGIDWPHISVATLVKQ